MGIFPCRVPCRVKALGDVFKVRLKAELLRPIVPAQSHRGETADDIEHLAAAAKGGLGWGGGFYVSMPYDVMYGMVLQWY